jgi:glycosyltransferase involved in cell wall biosynthesis
MKILFIHQNFPAQFTHLSAALAQDASNQVVALAMHERPVAPGVHVRMYSLLRDVSAATHPLLAEQESHVLRAEACASAALKLKQEGFEPDVIYAHPGWGEALFIKDVFPRAKLVIYCEYYYGLEGQDVGFDPEEPPLTFQQRCKLRLKNTTNLLSLQISDAAISPTEWQKSTYPRPLQDKITVIHDGIDTARLRFNPDARIEVQASDGAHHEFQPGDEVLSYVARNLEPVRGFPTFMRTLPEVLRRRPNAHAIIVGAGDVGYGRPAPNGRTWKEHMLTEVGGDLDLRRVHFTGKVSARTYLHLLSISRVHAYWTTPFVLSWSFLEALMSGLPTIASSTRPVLEFAGPLGVPTVDFFDQSQFVDALVSRLSSAPNRKGTPPTMRDIELKYCLAQQISLLKGM